MIVRISGHGQFSLDDSMRSDLHALDVPLTSALHDGREQEFHVLLQQVIDFVEHHGSRVPDDHIRASDVIVPPGDISMSDAQRFFTDEGLLQPVST